MEPINTNGTAVPGFYKEILDHMSDGVYFVDRDRRILYWNEGAYRLTGYKSEELLGKCCHEDILCHVDTFGTNLCQKGCPLTATITDGAPHQASVFLRHKEGRRVPVNVRVQPMYGIDGSIVGAIEIFSDDSAQYDAQRKNDAMNRLAFLDHVTQLPNRRFLEMSAQTALTEYQVHHDPFGVLMIDIDRFKEINDSFGHSCGDRALQHLGQTLTASLRPTDIVGRWGGDEFLAIVRNVKQGALNRLAERCALLAARTSIPSNDERRISFSISVGAALIEPIETADQLIHRADELMYRNKRNGRNGAVPE